MYEAKGSLVPSHVPSSEDEGLLKKVFKVFNEFYFVTVRDIA
jgi:hypothetical protein